MNILHAQTGADKHTFCQVPIDTLNNGPIATLTGIMDRTFRDALNRHIEENGTKIAKLSRDTGVSRDVINKLKSGVNQTTSAENAMLIAAYYGKSLEEFMLSDLPAGNRGLSPVMALLQPDEVEIIDTLIQGFLKKRGA